MKKLLLAVTCTLLLSILIKPVSTEALVTQEDKIAIHLDGVPKLPEPDAPYLDGTILRWKPINGAVGYRLKYSGGLFGVYKGTFEVGSGNISYDIGPFIIQQENLGNIGIYGISVQAIGDGINYKDSFESVRELFYVSGVKINDELLLNNGKVYRYGDGTASFNRNTGKLILNNVNITGKNQIAIETRGNVVIELVGNSTISMDSKDESACIYGDYLTVDGTGSLDLSNAQHGIFTQCVFKTRNANIKVHDVSGSGIFADYWAEFYGGDIEINSAGEYGIFSCNDMVIEDATIEAYASVSGIHSGTEYKISDYKPTGYVMYSGDNKETAVKITDINKFKSNKYGSIQYNKFDKMQGPIVTVESKGNKISWLKLLGATGYYIYRSTDGNTYSKIKTVVGETNTSFIDTNLVNGKKYYYCIEPYANRVPSEKSVATMTYYLSRPTIKSAKNVEGKKITVQLKAKNSKATGYQIQYVTGNKTKTLKVKGTKTLKKTITKLKKGKSYKVSVRFYKTLNKKTYYSAYSAVKTVKVKK